MMKKKKKMKLRSRPAVDRRTPCRRPSRQREYQAQTHHRPNAVKKKKRSKSKKKNSCFSP